MKNKDQLDKVEQFSPSLGGEQIKNCHCRGQNMNTPDQSEPDNNLNAVFEKIQEIAAKSVDGDYIYRGEPKCYETPPYCGKISSSLWREYCLDEKLFDIEIIQEQMLDAAKSYIHKKEDFEILTELQHYGGKTNLIDFTPDYLIALFFACDGHPDKDGRVILLQQTEAIKDWIKEPQDPRHRVIAQKSVFVRPPYQRLY